MRLETTVLPRKDGTVTAAIAGGRYVFLDHGDGVLSCDVDNPDHIRQLLDSGNFHPVHEADFETALAIQSAEEPAVEEAPVRKTRKVRVAQ